MSGETWICVSCSQPCAGKPAAHNGSGPVCWPCEFRRLEIAANNFFSFALTCQQRNTDAWMELLDQRATTMASHLGWHEHDQHE